MLDETWVIHWVRRPRSAQLLGLSPAFGLGDNPAILLPLAGLGRSSDERSKIGRSIGFMPQFESATGGARAEAGAIVDAAFCGLPGPGWPVSDVAFVVEAARMLSEAASAPQQPSAATVRDRCRTRMLERLEALRRDPLRATPG